MRNILIASAFALAGLSATAPSQTMPFASTDKALSMITLTAGGCGAGFHRGPNGGCRPNGGAYAHPYATAIAGGATACASAIKRLNA